MANGHSDNNPSDPIGALFEKLVYRPQSPREHAESDLMVFCAAPYSPGPHHKLIKKYKLTPEEFKELVTGRDQKREGIYFGSVQDAIADSPMGLVEYKQGDVEQYIAEYKRRVLQLGAGERASMADLGNEPAIEILSVGAKHAIAAFFNRKMDGEGAIEGDGGGRQAEAFLGDVREGVRSIVEKHLGTLPPERGK